MEHDGTILERWVKTLQSRPVVEYGEELPWNCLDHPTWHADPWLASPDAPQNRTNSTANKTYTGVPKVALLDF